MMSESLFTERYVPKIIVLALVFTLENLLFALRSFICFHHHTLMLDANSKILLVMDAKSHTLFEQILEYHPQMLQEYLRGGEQMSFMYPRLLPTNIVFYVN